MRGFMISLTRNGKAKGRKRAFQVLINNYLNDIHGSEHMSYQNTTVHTVVITWVAKMKTVQQYSFTKCIQGITSQISKVLQKCSQLRKQVLLNQILKTMQLVCVGPKYLARYRKGIKTTNAITKMKRCQIIPIHVRL